MSMRKCFAIASTVPTGRASCECHYQTAYVCFKAEWRWVNRTVRHVHYKLARSWVQTDQSLCSSLFRIPRAHGLYGGQSVLLSDCAVVLANLSLLRTCQQIPFQAFVINPLYSYRLFHCYILDESICHIKGVRSILWLFFYF